MTLSVQQYKEIILIALDHQLAEHKSGLVFDDIDVAVQADKKFRARVDRLVRRKEVDKLEGMLQQLIQRFRVKDSQNFASILYQKTGYNFEPIPSEQISLSTSRNLRFSISGKGDNSLTCVSIELPTGSGSIYCIKGQHLDLRAYWLGDETIEILTPSKRDELVRISQVKMYNETIVICYKEL